MPDFTPPPLSSHEGPTPAAAFTPPPLSSHQGPTDTDFLTHAGSSTWDNIKGAFNLATGADLWNKAIESAKAGKYDEAAKAFQGIVEGPAARVADSVIDTAAVAAKHMKDAASKLVHGDTEGASASANAAGLHIATVLAPHAEQAAENFKQGNYGAGAGDLTGDALAYLAAKGIHVAPEAAGAAVDAAGSAVAAVKNAASHPATGLAVDLVGMAHPGAAYAIHAAKTVGRFVGKISDALRPEEPEESAPAVDPNAPPEGVPQAWWDRLSPEHKQDLRTKLAPNQSQPAAPAATPPPLPNAASARAPKFEPPPLSSHQGPAGPPEYLDNGALLRAADARRAVAVEPPVAPGPPEYLDNGALLRAADARRAVAVEPPVAPAAEPITPAPALGRAAAPTTSQPKTILNDVDAYLAQRRAERAASTPQPPPPGEPGEAAAPAPAPPPPAAPAAPAAANIRDGIAQRFNYKNFATIKDPNVAATVQRLADQQAAREPEAAPAAFTDTETSGLQIPRVVNARQAIVNNMADYFHQGGLKAADLETRRAQPAAWDLLWKNAAKKSGSKQGAAYTPSADTISATIERLESLEKSKAAEEAQSDLEDKLIRSLLAAREKNAAKVSDLMPR